MISKIALIIEDELKHPDKYKPIARGPWMALCLMAALGSLVPFWVGYLALRQGCQVIGKALRQRYDD